MAHSQFDLFLEEALHLDPAAESKLDRDSLYGLYTSWCFISQKAPHPESDFWAAMNGRIDPSGSGISMKGPAAADYILASSPGLV